MSVWLVSVSRNWRAVGCGWQGVPAATVTIEIVADKHVLYTDGATSFVLKRCTQLCGSASTGMVSVTGRQKMTSRPSTSATVLHLSHSI